jgi:thiosulfate sulfurtransferase
MTDFKRIAPAQAQALRAQGGVVVDIRDPQSFAMGHISGSQHLDNHSLHDFIAKADLDQPLVVVCYHGNSSQSAAAYLVGQGFAWTVASSYGAAPTLPKSVKAPPNKNISPPSPPPPRPAPTNRQTGGAAALDLADSELFFAIGPA